MVAAVNPQFFPPPIGTTIRHLDLRSFHPPTTAFAAFSCWKLGQRMTQDKSSASSWAAETKARQPLGGETMAEKATKKPKKPGKTTPCWNITIQHSC